MKVKAHVCSRRTCKRLLPSSRTETTFCQNSPAQLGVHRPAHSAHQLWHCVTQSLNTVVLFGRDPVMSVSWTPNSTTLCVYYQAVCGLCRPRGYLCWPTLLLRLYVVGQPQTNSSVTSRPILTGPCMPMCLITRKNDL